MMAPASRSERGEKASKTSSNMILREHLINGGQITHTGAVICLKIPPTSDAAYVDAQLDDYDHPRREFANVPPHTLQLRARFSHPIGKLKGTAGFGFWNNPFSQTGSVVEPPSNVWFFYGSPESDMQVVPNMPGHGFKAAVLDSLPLPSGDRIGVSRSKSLTNVIVAAGNLALRIPIVSSLAMRAAQRMVHAHETVIDHDITKWHDYSIWWMRDAAIFHVDGHEVLRAPRPPRGTLGFVTWIDNYRASATRDGRYEFGYVDVAEEQWLELQLGGEP
jgi:hypothetical protein